MPYGKIELNIMTVTDDRPMLLLDAEDDDITNKKQTNKKAKTTITWCHDTGWQWNAETNIPF